MKKLLIGLGLAVATLAASAQVTVRLNGEVAPGVYGRVTIGDDRPRLVYTQPQVIVRDRTYVEEPVYLYVPQQHQRRWSRYCHRYDACNRPVYFVQERWVKERWESRQERRHMERPNREWRDGRWHDRDEPRMPHDRGDRPGYGNWKHGDKDRDGVPNRVDRDRDGDGVRNERDNRPNNPNRQ